jgi:uncharacterized protein (DUF302 family)
MLKGLSIAALWLFFSSALAGAPAVFVQQTDLDIEQAYKRVYEALEEHKFWVVFEADLADRMSRFREKWGEDYNRSKLTGAKSMVFCNIWWTNRIASADPDMLAICPLHVSLYAREGTTSVVLLRPSAVAQGSGAEAEAVELEQELTDIIESALK